MNRARNILMALAAVFYGWFASYASGFVLLVFVVLVALIVTTALKRKQIGLVPALVFAFIFVIVGTIHDLTVEPHASARCRDGHYSYSWNRSGTCSWHGGVAEWNPRVSPWWEFRRGQQSRISPPMPTH